ncbi:lipopolysaccharide assembly protein LapA domain-containing protein [Vibrio scophthalmi]|uniref:Probable lipopolysaccharide assembly protein A n=2 Tax=Vibrio scophthalmi TaxID=45658 RepID=A0A1B1NMT5_9VIBR|nr:lipopolysaccharide assembly protein LapA domain-containing protein [Vibrio scophthalmi]ANS84965.1 putative lipopolysaccharide assembly protein [Vibrio scophthalmi]ANU36925.1 putative lipopolysaccharide assembly protein [Vibrio scophthalmi]EGU35416.1 putative membrane protein [Vibrio scophthalmi LMG 19158]MCY9802081.1 lipopolysaccharide assembly protein LapA domain-containing protein [Vibrio scophthalmi]ODS11872.1 putative lipopolysaccharide assembly protein [Vibrio scophthalmi]
MKIIKIVIVLALFLVALALGSQNQAVVNFNYLLAQGDFHLSTLLGVVFVTGFAVAWIIFGTLHLKSQLQIRKLNKQLKKLTPASTEVVQNKA